MHKTQFKKGYSLVEMLIYVGILSIISIVIVNMLLSFTQTYRVVTALRMAEHSGIDAMDRMTRDIRAASTVDPAISKFGVANGELYLTATANGVSTTTDFYLENNIVKVKVNGVYLGPLSLSNTQVTSLNFHYLDSGISSAIKIDMAVTAVSGSVTRSKTYHSTVIMKGE